MNTFRMRKAERERAQGMESSSKAPTQFTHLVSKEKALCNGKRMSLSGGGLQNVQMHSDYKAQLT